MLPCKRVNRDASHIEKTLLSLELACAGVDKTIATLQKQILKPAEEELHLWLEKMDLFGETRIDLQRQHLLPSLTIDGVDRSLMLLSGSEKMFLYLCFKVALANVLGNPGFFVFDDPTLHLDSERKALMVDFIRQLAEEHQVVVTSYDEDVRAGLEGAHLIEMTRETPFKTAQDRYHPYPPAYCSRQQPIRYSQRLPQTGGDVLRDL